MDRIKIFIILALIISLCYLVYYCNIQEDFGNYQRRHRRHRRHYRRGLHPYYYNNYNLYRPYYWYDYLSPWSRYYSWRRPYNYSQVSPILD